MSERLQKFLARAGVASRRHAEGLITAGRVRVNNQRVTELGTQGGAGTDLVTVDGTLVTAPETHLLVPAPQAAGGGDHAVGPRGPAHRGRAARGGGAAGVPGGAARLGRRGSAAAHQRRGGRAPAAAPELRGAADVSGQGEGRRPPTRRSPGCARGFASRTARRARCGPSASRAPRRTPGSCSRSARGGRTSSSASARRWATRWCGCSARPRRASRSPGCSRASCGR